MAKEFNMIFAGGTGVMHQDGNSAISMEESGVSDNKLKKTKMTEVKKDDRRGN